MEPFWDVLWSDTKALAVFVVPMLVLSLPAGGLGAWLGTITRRSNWPANVRLAMLHGTLFGAVFALIISMAVEFSFQAEGLSDARRALRDVAWLRLCLVGPLTALAAGFLAAKQTVSAPTDPRSRRRYTLRQLFIGQLI